MNCLVDFSIPGTKDPRDDLWMLALISLLKEKGIEGQFVDTVMGWGCLNQDWYETTMEMDTSWGWCLPKCFNDEENKFLLDLLDSGRILMQVSYKTEDGFIPHH